MSSSRVPEAAPPAPLDPTKAQEAFGARALPKLREELESNDLTRQLCALQLLKDLAHGPETVSGAVEAGVLTGLLRLSDAEDGQLRTLATAVLAIFATAALGRQALMANDGVATLARRFNDPLEAVRLAAHLNLARLCTSFEGTQVVLGANLVATLTHKLPLEPPAIQTQILESLQLCLRHDTTQALAAGLIPVLIAVLNNNPAAPVSVVSGAARALLGCTIAPAGKVEAVAAHAVAPIVRLLQHDDSDVRAMAAACITGIAITTEGKFAFLKADVQAPLIALLDDRSEAVVLHAVKAMTILAEAPAGRTSFAPCVARLTALLTVKGLGRDPAAIARVSQTCINTITWRP